MSTTIQTKLCGVLLSTIAFGNELYELEMRASAMTTPYTRGWA